MRPILHRNSIGGYDHHLCRLCLHDVAADQAAPDMGGVLAILDRRPLFAQPVPKLIIPRILETKLFGDEAPRVANRWSNGVIRRLQLVKEPLLTARDGLVAARQQQEQAAVALRDGLPGVARRI